MARINWRIVKRQKGDYERRYDPAEGFPDPSDQCVRLIAAGSLAMEAVGHKPDEWRYQRIPAPGWGTFCRCCGATAAVAICIRAGVPQPYVVLSMPETKCPGSRLPGRFPS